MTNTGKVFEEYEALLKRIGENLARVRMARGMTQRQLSQVMGKNQCIVAKVEKYPSRDITFRCIYEVCRGLPVSMGDIVTQAERELDLHHISRAPSAITQRMKVLTERLNALPEEEQEWIAEMIDALLKRTLSPQKSTDKTDRNHFNHSLPTV